jgi:hypothetical protein
VAAPGGLTSSDGSPVASKPSKGKATVSERLKIGREVGRNVSQGTKQLKNQVQGAWPRAAKMLGEG